MWSSVPSSQTMKGQMTSSPPSALSSMNGRGSAMSGTLVKAWTTSRWWFNWWFNRWFNWWLTWRLNCWFNWRFDLWFNWGFNWWVGWNKDPQRLGDSCTTSAFYFFFHHSTKINQSKQKSTDNVSNTGTTFLSFSKRIFYWTASTRITSPDHNGMYSIISFFFFCP